MRGLGLWCFDRNRRVVATWIGAVIVLWVLAGSIGGSASNDFTLPNTESKRALDLLERKFPRASGETSQLVFHTSSGTLREKRAEVEGVVAAVRRAPTVLRGAGGVTDPLAGPISRDGRTAFATITHDETGAQLDLEEVKKLIEQTRDSPATAAARRAGIEVELGGGPILQADASEGSIAEVIGIVVAAVVLFVVLGSVSAVFMPLIATFMAVVTGAALITLLMGVMSVADFALFLMTLISVGVGIDYGLLILSRVRNELAKGAEPRAAMGTAIDTAGRSVLFAAITVCIALCGMFVLGLSFLNGPAIGAAAGVALTMLSSLTLLPALVASRPFAKRLKAGSMANPDQESHFWARYSRFVQRHPGKLMALGLLILLVAASPMLNMRLASTDAGNATSDKTARKAYDLLSNAFGPGFNGPFIAAVDRLRPGQEGRAQADRLAQAFRSDPGVAQVDRPVFNEAGDTATITVTPDSKPQDETTKDTLQRLRDDVLPPVESSTGARVDIGGFTAVSVDFAKVLAGKLPGFIAVIVGLSLLLLLVVFRSIAIPIKAGILNALSIGTALGVITWVFQEGNLLSLIGADQTGPIEPFLPVMMFAIVFGLSMDYEVFLVTRMHEEWEHTKDHAYAVRHGMALTGKVITAAALIMISVFMGFSLTDDTTNKLFGLGFAAAIFFDAFVIRMLVVPSVMFLIGRRVWWLPAWLDRILPRVSIEGPAEPERKADPETART